MSLSRGGAGRPKYSKAQLAAWNEQASWNQDWLENEHVVFSEAEERGDEIDTHWEARLYERALRDEPPPTPPRKYVSLGEKLENNARRAKYFGAKTGLSAEDWVRWCAAFGNRCAYCGTQLKTPVLEHVVPLSRGGTDTIGNVVPSCVVCNRRKGTRTPFEWLKSEELQDAFTQRVITALEAYKCGG